jgi:glucokinase
MTSPDAEVRMGIDVGGSSIKWVVLERERVVDRGSVATPTAGPAAVLRVVAGLARDRGDGAGAVGLALPAVIDAVSGSTLVAPNLPGDWSGQPVAAPLAAELDLPVTVCNDARAFTRAEWLLGAGRGRHNLVAITLGTGVGGGIVADGRLVEGRSRRAGELGHRPVEPAGVRCGCGAIGCLETVAGARALVREARGAIERGEAPLLGAVDALTPEAVVDAARQGDPGAGAVMTRAGEAIGRALAGLVTGLASEIVVVGGGLATALDVLGPVIRARLRERSALTGDCQLVASALGLHAGAIGAAVWRQAT